MDAPPSATAHEGLHALLRAELAAVTAYDRAITRFQGEAVATDLRRIRDEHEGAAAALRGRAAACGAGPAEGAGGWGEFATAVSGAADLPGLAAVLAALRQGEQHEVNEYETALTDPDLDAGCKDLIRSDLLPRSRAHVTDLDRLLAGAG